MVLAHATNDQGEPRATLRHFEPSDQVDWSLFHVALDLAAKGYPVIAGRPRSKRPLARGMRGTTDPSTLKRWWARSPDANPLIDVTKAGVMVFDVDDEEGERWLTRLADHQHGGLPDTSVVRTHRGRHLWFRLPEGCPPLVNQSGEPNGPHPGLDVKFTWLVAAPGAYHPKGGAYVAEGEVPPVSALALLPRPVYDALAAVGRPRGVKATRSRVRRTPASPSAPDSALVVLGRRLGTLLGDTRDGREARTLSAVRMLVLRGLGDDQVKAIVLGAPLGEKALEQPDPDLYLQRKIGWCREHSGDVGPTSWQPVALWQAALHARLSATQLRVLVVLLRRACRSGTVSRSVDLIGLDAATSAAGASAAVSALVQSGWLLVIEAPPQWERIPRTFRLRIPEGVGQILNPTAPPIPTPPATKAVGVQDLSRVAGHDAFRCAPGSLHAAFPLMCLLADRPRTPNDLMSSLDKSAKTITRHLDDLDRGGLLKRDGDLVSLHLGQAGLHRVAVAARTHGARRKAIDRYREKLLADAEARRKWLAEARSPGTPTWQEQARRFYGSAVTRPEFQPLVTAWVDDGGTVADLVENLVDAEAASHRRHTGWFDLPGTALVTTATSTIGHTGKASEARRSA